MLGTGMVAGWLRKGFNGCQKSDLCAVASRSSDKASAFATEHGIPKAYGSYEDLVADESIEVVLVALPNTLHRECALKAAEAGKHVLCEKPLAMRGADVESMAQACQQKGVRLMEGAMYRFQPQIRKTLELVGGGRIGKPRLIQAAFCFPFRDRTNIRLKKEMGGGCLFDMGFYPVSFALLVAGKAPFNVFGASFYGETEVDEATSAALQFEEGVSAVAECAFRTEIKVCAEITGEEGAIRLPDPWTARGTRKEVQVWKARKLAESVEMEDPNAYTLEIDHFSEVVRGETPQLWTLEDSLRVIRTLEAISRSARIGESVRL
jgi:predicted dehydrogenase